VYTIAIQCAQWTAPRASLKLLNEFCSCIILPIDAAHDLLFRWCRSILAVSSINVPLNTLLKLMEARDYLLISFIYMKRHLASQWSSLAHIKTINPSSTYRLRWKVEIALTTLNFWNVLITGSGFNDVWDTCIECE